MATDFNFNQLKDESLDFNFGADLTYHNILRGTSNNFIAIWADANTSLTTGKMFVSSNGSGASFNVVNIGNNKVVDYYTLEHKGSTDQYLEAEDIADISCL